MTNKIPRFIHQVDLHLVKFIFLEGGQALQMFQKQRLYHTMRLKREIAKLEKMEREIAQKASEIGPDHNVQTNTFTRPKQNGSSSTRNHGSSTKDHGSNSRNHGSNPRDHGSNPRDHGSNLRDHGSNPRDHGSNPRDHGSNPRDHGSNPRDHGSNSRDHRSNLRDYGSSTRDQTESSTRDLGSAGSTRGKPPRQCWGQASHSNGITASNNHYFNATTEVSRTSFKDIHDRRKAPRNYRYPIYFYHSIIIL